MNKTTALNELDHIEVLNRIIPALEGRQSPSKSYLFKYAAQKYMLEMLHLMMTKTRTMKTLNFTAEEFMIHLLSKFYLDSGRMIDLVELMSDACRQEMLREVAYSVEGIRMGWGLKDKAARCHLS